MLNLITNPDAAAFPPQDDVQFLSGWPSGNELAGFSSVIRQVSSETYPNTVQIVNIDANPGANNYKMMLYLSLNPSQDGVRTPPNLQYKAIPFSSDMPYFNQWLFHYSQVRSDQVTLVEMQASDEQRLNWSKNNPEFQLVAQYNKPAKFAYWLYKYNPPASINNPETANLSGQGDLVAQLRLSQPGPKPNQFGTQLKIQNVGNGKAVNITVSIPTGPDYKLSFIDFGDKAKITGQTDQVTQLAVTSLGPNESINGSLIFEGSPKSPNTPSDIRYSLNWVDGKGPGQFTMSNSIALTTSGEISSQPAASPANGSTQPLKATTPAGQSEGLMEFEGNFYIPGEIVTYWITDKAGKSTELGKTTADSKGSINLKLDAKTFSPGSYTLAAYGNRSEVTGSLLIRF